MKRAFGIAALIFGAPMLQGALVPLLPAALRPDLALLVVLGLALCWRSPASGMALAAAGGFAVDLLSGGLLGQHALVAVLVFTGSRALSVHVSLLTPAAQFLFAGALTAVYAVTLLALTAFFTPGAGLGPLGPGTLVLHALANACVAPVVIAIVSGLVRWVGGADDGRRLLRFETRRWA